MAKKQIKVDKGLFGGISSRMASRTETKKRPVLRDIEIKTLSINPINPRTQGKLTVEQVCQIRDGKKVNLDKDQQAFLDSLRELAESIRTQGLLQPPVVKKTGPDSYELIAGERRFLAHHYLGREFITIFDQHQEDDLQAFLRTIAENFQREDLTLLEQVDAIDNIEKLYSVEGKKLTGEDLAKLLNKSRSSSFRMLQISRAPDELRAMIVSGEITTVKQAIDVIGNNKQETATTKKEKPKKTVGAPKVSVNLGRVKKTSVIKSIITACESEKSVKDIDWNDFHAVEKAWVQFIKRLSK